MSRISVIMPCYLQPYEGAARKPKEKLVRAVLSFLAQKHENRELVLVSDGDEDVKKVYEKNFKKVSCIVLVEIEKQPMFSGNVRQAGIDKATGDIIAYLDADDVLEPQHLTAINACMNKNNWIYFNDWLFNGYQNQLRITELEKGLIGTSCIAHINKKEFSWAGCNGYGHDWLFIQKLMKSKKCEKAMGMGYVAMHYAAQNIDF